MHIFIMTLYFLTVTASLSAGAVAACSDFRGMKIPNCCSLAVLVSFVVSFCVIKFSGMDSAFSFFVSHFLSGAVLFGLTYALFAFGAFGAGDSKLITAYGFWFGLEGLPVFVFWVTMLGAVLAIFAMVLMRIPAFSGAPEGSWIARLSNRERVVPYGIAIFFGAFASFCFLGYFGVSLSA